ncbi:MAG: sensor histidine kinase KdpD [Parachlamydia sp.]|nr:sensor histidine kinase KdpD [Parachlamydia sp.]
MNEEERPDPEALLSAIKRQERKAVGGLLRIFFGMSAGVGKTYAMLEAGRERSREGVDVVIGIVDTHGRKETEELLHGYEIVPQKQIVYRDATFSEMDLDALLQRKPQLAIVDELAHTNVPGSRHPKRWQDVMELLDAGIDVYTTLNVQHLESRKDLVEGITGIPIRETVPDLVLERAIQIALVDITPEELLKRLKEGKVYLGAQSEIAARHFFQEDRLTALREIALRFTAEKVDHDLHAMKVSLKEFGKGWRTKEHLLVAISSSPYSQQLIRTARRIAFNLDAPWIALYVDTGIPLSEEESDRLSNHLTLARDLGGEVITVSDPDLVKTIQRVARQHDVTQIILGRPIKNFLRELWEGGSLLDRLNAEIGDIDIHVIRQIHIPGTKKKGRPFFRQIEFLSYWKSLLWVLGLAIAGQLLKETIGYQAVGFIFFIGNLLLGLMATRGTLYFAAIVSSLIWYFYFVPSERAVYDIIEDFAMVGLYFIAAAVIGSLTKRLHTSDMLLQAHEEKTHAVYEIIKEIANAKSSADLMKGIEQRLGRILQGICEIFLADPEGNLTFPPTSLLLKEDKEKAVATWVYKSGKAAGWSTDTLPLVKNLYIPMKGYQDVVGVIAYQPKFGRKLNMEEINLLHNVAQHLANYTWRTFMEETALKKEYLNRIEKIHYAILKSLSFQPSPTLEVPLHEEPSIPALFSKTLATQETPDNLQQLIENLLAMTKTSTGFFSVNKKPESIYDLIDACTSNLKYFLSRYNLKVNLAPDIPPILMDFALMELMICNILIHAAENSPEHTTIAIHVEADHNRLTIRIQDEGRGIPAEELPKIFEKFYHPPGEVAAGAGLGLAIAKNIAELHQGTIKAQNRPTGGLEIEIELPLF